VNALTVHEKYYSDGMLKTHLRHYRVLSIVYWNTYVTLCYNLLTSARSFGLITVNILADLDILCDTVVSKRWSWRHTLLYIALTYFHLIFSQQFYYWLSCQWKYLRSPVYRKVSFFVIADRFVVRSIGHFSRSENPRPVHGKARFILSVSATKATLGSRKRNKWQNKLSDDLAENKENAIIVHCGNMVVARNI